ETHAHRAAPEGDESHLVRLLRRPEESLDAQEARQAGLQEALKTLPRERPTRLVHEAADAVPGLMRRPDRGGRGPHERRPGRAGRDRVQRPDPSRRAEGVASIETRAPEESLRRDLAVLRVDPLR